MSTSVDTEELKSTDNTDSGSQDHVVLVSNLPEGPRVVYFSSSTENTRRFVDKVGIPSRALIWWWQDGTEARHPEAGDDFPEGS